MLSGDVVHLEDNFERNIVPSLNTNQADSLASMERVRQVLQTYNAKLFINHDKRQTEQLKLLPEFYD
jgi:N-acyl homoserine lactone hydrolase